jgi:hypothetical protein
LFSRQIRENLLGIPLKFFDVAKHCPRKFHRLNYSLFQVSEETIKNRSTPCRFLHGICIVPLTEMNDARLLAPTVAEALGVAPANQQDPAQLVVEFLRAREVLLVLDNFEQLAGEAD